MQDTAPPAQPPAIYSPAPEFKRGVAPVVAPMPTATPVVAPTLPPPPPALSDAAVRAALIQQAGALKAAAKTAEATKTAAETAATNAWWAAILALVGAVFAAFVAWRNGWLAARTTQQMKHADFRQKWIDSLREDMARLTRTATQMEGDPKKHGELRENISAIILRMNKHDPEYHKLIDEMGIIAKAAEDSSLVKNADKLSEFLLVSQRVLKREWEVTKVEMHATPWGRPFSWIANWMRRRRREEDREIVRRKREKVSLTPPKPLGALFRWPFVWRRRQAPPVNPEEPVFNIGRFEIYRRKPKPVPPASSDPS